MIDDEDNKDDLKEESDSGSVSDNKVGEGETIEQKESKSSKDSKKKASKGGDEVEQDVSLDESVSDEQVDALLDDIVGASSAPNEEGLDQSEIDSLLKGKTTQTNIDAIINSDLIYYERLPMLEVVFDRLVRMLSTSLRNFTSDNVEVSFDGITTLRFGDYLNSMPLPTMLSVFRAEQWDNQGLLVIDNEMIYSVVDVLLGARRSNSIRAEGRSYTTIERNLIQRMMKVILTDFRLAFEPISNVSFRFERLEINPHFAMIVRPANAALLVKMHVQMEERGGKIEILLPYATIEPIRELLLQNFMGEKFGRDSIWENHLSQQLWNTDIMLEVMLKPESMTLHEVLDWKVGTQILLQSTPDSIVYLNSGGQPLFAGKVGQKSGKVAIKVEEVLFGGEEITKEREEGEERNE